MADINTLIADKQAQIARLKASLAGIKDVAEPKAPEDSSPEDIQMKQYQGAAQAMLATDPQGAMNLMDKAQALKDKKDARIFAIQQQGDPNSPGNVSKIASQLQSAIEFVGGPGFQALDEGAKKAQAARILALQDQLNQTSLGKAFASSSGASASTSSDGTLQDLSAGMTVSIDKDILTNPPKLGVLPESTILKNFRAAFAVGKNQNDPLIKSATEYISQKAKEAKSAYEASGTEAERARSAKSAIDAEFDRWLNTYKDEVDKVKSAVSAVSQLAQKEKNPNNAALNMAIVDSFVKSAVGGKVTQYAAGNIGTMAESWLGNLGSKFGWHGQAYSDKTITDAGSVSADEGLQALKTLAVTNPKYYDRFYKEFVAAPLASVNSGMASKFASNPDKATRYGITPSSSRKATLGDF